MHRWRVHSRFLQRRERRKKAAHHKHILDVLAPATKSPDVAPEDVREPSKPHFMALGVWPVLATSQLTALSEPHEGLVFLGTSEELDFIKECEEPHPVYETLVDVRQATTGDFLSPICLDCPVNTICSEKLKKEIMSQ